MKKSLFFVAAASALMLTACSSEGDVLQSATQPQTTVQEQAVGFNVYTPAATGVTRAGLVGTMTTGRMQRSESDQGGFGVYSFLTEDKVGTAGTNYENPKATTYYDRTSHVPDFMVNEKVLWNSDSQGWYYNPLKYWPNETDYDSQSSAATMTGTKSHLDRLTFFAYAPYVSGNDGTGTGITYITDKAGQLNGVDTSDPTIAWKATTADATFNPNEGVDLLWGVAPSGGLSYTAVNGWTVTKNEGTPLIDMIKPNVNTSMKFLFNHALARFGITVVAAVDQVSPGGELDPNTKITIDNVKITGKFGTTGELNLNNDGHPSVANWTKIQDVATAGITAASALTSNTITVTANSTTGTNAIAENLRFAGSHTSPSEQNVVGVTPAKQDLLVPSKKWFNKLASTPAYNPAKQYYDVNGNAVSATYKTTREGEYYTYESTPGKYVAVTKNTTIYSPDFPTYNKDTDSPYYTVGEGSSFKGNHVDTYSFTSWGDAEATATPWGSGSVRIVSQDATTTTVEVVTNSVASFVGQQFKVNATDLTSVTSPLQLYNLDGTATSPAIYVKEIAPATYGYTDGDLATTTIIYEKKNAGTTEAPEYWYDYVGTKANVTWNSSNAATYVTVNPSPKININAIPYAYDPTQEYYEAERSYLYVVPTNNVWAQNAGLGTNPTDLRTITVQIEYYITTEDSKLNAQRAQTKNVITKEVVLPSLANGKSYNLNLVLGLTSVKVEAEVSDWKVENVNADLPQNTGE